MLSEVNKKSFISHIRSAYLVLLVGSIGSLGCFALIFPWEWEDPYLRLIGFIFGVVSPMALWIVSPMALAFVVIFILSKNFKTYGAGIVSLVTSLVIVVFGIGYYIKVIFFFPNQETNLVFIFVPIYQLVATLILGIICLIIGIFTKSRIT